MNKNKIKTFFLIFAFVSFSVLSCLFLDLSVYADKSTNADNSKKLVVILPGQNLSTIANCLDNTGIIKNPIKFKLLARIKGCDKKIKAGEYLFSSSMAPIQILKTMASGKVRLYKITIPEGYNLKQIASIISKAKLGTREDFLKAATDSSFACKHGINAETFEGYLFPETYHFPKDITPGKIIATMVERFRSIFNRKWEKRAKDLNLSIHQVVTLAS
ncbi:MAG: endolytic transglycosylase MltG, partial [Elusimicrobiota bacterium]|nr:endolytic transglycosylase MltG [Elusimicrobiota bacterium]